MRCRSSHGGTELTSKGHFLRLFCECTERSRAAPPPRTIRRTSSARKATSGRSPMRGRGRTSQGRQGAPRSARLLGRQDGGLSAADLADANNAGATQVAAERARAAVTMRIRAALLRIEKEHPASWVPPGTSDLEPGSGAGHHRVLMMDALTRPLFPPLPLWKRGIKGDLPRSHRDANPLLFSQTGANPPEPPFSKGGFLGSLGASSQQRASPRAQPRSAPPSPIKVSCSTAALRQTTRVTSSSRCSTRCRWGAGGQHADTHTGQHRRWVVHRAADFGGNAFNGADRFLQIAVRCPVGSGSYTTLTPRQPLTAAPYALYSPVAGVANDLTCTGCLSTTDWPTAPSPPRSSATGK